MSGYVKSKRLQVFVFKTSKQLNDCHVENKTIYYCNSNLQNSALLLG